MSREPRTSDPAWAAQFREALEAYLTASPRSDRAIRQEARLTHQQLADLRSGAVVPPRRSAVARQVVRGLVWAAMYEDGEGSDDGSFVRPQLYTIAHAIDPHTALMERERWEEHDEEMNESRRQRTALAAGLHVAPIVSEAGRFVLVSVDGAGRLRSLVELTGARGVEREDDGAWFDAGADLTLPGAPNAYAHPLLARGVHFAPWLPWDGDVCLIAVGTGGRLLARMDVPGTRNLAGRRAARRELAAVLEILDPAAPPGSGYRDTPDDGLGGDEWKRGTPYDPRVRN